MDSAIVVLASYYIWYCPTIGIAIIDLLYNFLVAIGTGNNVAMLMGWAIRENSAF